MRFVCVVTPPSHSVSLCNVMQQGDANCVEFDLTTIEVSDETKDGVPEEAKLAVSTIM